MTTLTLAQALMQAMKAEREGQSFYLMAAGATQDAKGKTIFETLAAEELDHFQFLRLHYESVNANGRLSDSALLGARRDLSDSSPIFSESLKNRIREAHHEMSSLAIGIQLELDAMKFYQEQSQTAADPQARKLFADLAEWEKGHYHALLRQQEALRGDYWSDAGFTPF